MTSSDRLLADSEYLAIRDDMLTATTAAQFDDAIARLMGLLQKHVPPAFVNRCVGTFIRGVLEGAGFKAPWIS